MSDTEDHLEHYGVVGMKWGHRKSELPGVSAKTNREARKDAEEHARAKMFYGEGAGTRRKLHKAKVEAKAKKDPSYKKAFDHHLANQDLGSHASKARVERKRKDVSNSTRKTARGVGHVLRGNPQYASLFVVGAVGVAGYAHNKGIDKFLLNQGKRVLTDARARKSVNLGREFLKNL